MRVYSAQEGSLIINGLDIKEGTDPAGFLSFSPKPQFTFVKDIHGNYCRSRTNDPLVDVTLKLWNWSPHNQQLSGLLVADTLSNAGDGIGVFNWLDTQGATLVTSDTCCIVQAPDDWTIAEEAFVVTWRLAIFAPPEQMILGGN